MTNSEQIIIFSVIFFALYLAETIYKGQMNKRAEQKQREIEQQKIELEKGKMHLDDEKDKRLHELDLARLEKEAEIMQLLQKLEKIETLMESKNISTEHFAKRSDEVLKPLLKVASESEGVELKKVNYE